jgi:hypothetical protein
MAGAKGIEPLTLRKRKVVFLWILAIGSMARGTDLFRMQGENGIKFDHSSVR